ncbi:B3/B4 domain-containing protein [Nonomuraea sp. SBT364]|uniref:B3/B4 domain-containing protein n=1 Tax=Nonomuraea sp. SBT364 TaxID=1580530 RepID=UPI00066EB805|nr:phenylalanine--tRNA ligase beta subunit-related protein [Nonomuraea sp. SBT364]
MHFQHESAIWRDFPELVPGTILAEGITPDAVVDGPLLAHHAAAAERLAGGAESELPEIRAWRRAFSRMGLKPTQYRCASESLLRRFKKEGALPRIHPLIDLCNAVSLAFAIPVAVFDLARVEGFLEVRHASGEEEYVTLAGQAEHPEPGEVIFADGGGHAHARRWTNRQSGLSAVRGTTASVLIVAEALHPTAAEDVRKLTEVLCGELSTAWGITPAAAVLGPASPRLDF